MYKFPLYLQLTDVSYCCDIFKYSVIYHFRPNFILRSLYSIPNILCHILYILLQSFYTRFSCCRAQFISAIEVILVYSQSFGIAFWSLFWAKSVKWEFEQINNARCRGNGITVQRWQLYPGTKATRKANIYKVLAELAYEFDCILPWICWNVIEQYIKTSHTKRKYSNTQFFINKKNENCFLVWDVIVNNCITLNIFFATVLLLSLRICNFALQ